MADPTSKNMQELQDAAASLKDGMSTSKIWKVLFITSNKTPRNISFESKVLDRAVAVVAELSIADTKLKSGVSETRNFENDARVYADKLENFVSTIGVGEDISNKLETLRPQISSLSSKHITLQDKLATELSQNNQLYQDIFNRLSKKDITESRAKEEIAKTSAPIKEIEREMKTLREAALPIQEDLKSIMERAKTAADNVAPPTPQELSRLRVGKF